MKRKTLHDKNSDEWTEEAVSAARMLIASIVFQRKLDGLCMCTDCVEDDVLEEVAVALGRARVSVEMREAGEAVH